MNTDTLPPLPAAFMRHWINAPFEDVTLYTADQMRDYARAALAAVPAQPVSSDVLREALSFYADETRYHGPNQTLDAADKWTEQVGLKAYRLDVTRDRGVIAKKALAAAPQAVPVPADMALTDDPWRKLYRRAINEANGLTNYVEDRPELRGAERRLAAIEAEARTLAATFEPTPEKKP